MAITVARARREARDLSSQHFGGGTGLIAALRHTTAGRLGEASDAQSSSSLAQRVLPVPGAAALDVRCTQPV